MEINLELSVKQTEAWELLHDKQTVELLFGGGAGGGKTRLLCMFSIITCLKYNGIRGFLGRNSLEDFKKSTLLSLYDVLSEWGLKQDVHYTHNQQEKCFTFLKTGSAIYYNELSYYPSDPNYDYLGSTEYTFAGIDEANQVTSKAKNTLFSRIRYKVSQTIGVPKLVMSCNPDKGHLYADFYKPWKLGKLPHDRAFVQSLVTDNPHIDPTYLANLQRLDPVTKERLLYGNWEYDNDPARLIEYDAITDIFTNVIAPSTQNYIIADIARFGDDRTVISYWEGLLCKRISAYQGLSIVQTSNKIGDWRKEYAVPVSHILVDEDGVGGGVRDIIGCKGFIAQSRAFGGQKYSNLKSQCYFTLAERINARKIGVRTENPRIKELITEELEQVKAKDIDKDKALSVVSKDMVKEKIGHSPDFSDTLAMRMWFELAPKPSITVINLPSV